MVSKRYFNNLTIADIKTCLCLTCPSKYTKNNTLIVDLSHSFIKTLKHSVHSWGRSLLIICIDWLIVLIGRLLWEHVQFLWALLCTIKSLLLLNQTIQNIKLLSWILNVLKKNKSSHLRNFADVRKRKCDLYAWNTTWNQFIHHQRAAAD